MSTIHTRFTHNQFVRFNPILLGGKGGFIAQLKKEGAKMKPSDNTDKLRTKQNKSGKTEKLLNSLKEGQRQPPPEKKPKRILKEPEQKLYLKKDTIDSDREKQEALMKKLFKK